MAATAVTPTGVRDGDPEALAGLCDVRGPAVLAYCEVVVGRGERGAFAAAEALGSFRAGVVQAGDLATLNPEALLISATRHAAARHAAAEAPAACARVPQLLAARADRSIAIADDDWLTGHLDTCWTCRAPVARFEVADKAYREPPDAPLPADVKAAMVAAMNAAAPVHLEAAAPDAGAPHAEPYTAYDLPAVDVAAAALDQPTAAYEMPAEDLAEPTDDARRAGRLRRRRGTAAPGAGGTTLARPRRELTRRPTRRGERGSLRPAVLLPVALVVIAIVAALAVAGVFGGGEPASAPRSYAPAATDTPTKKQAAPVVVVSGANAASAAAVEKAKAKARAAEREAAASADDDAAPTAATTTPAAAAETPPPAVTRPPPPPPPSPPPPPAATKGGGAKPKIDAGNGATGAEQLPPAQDTSTVPDLAPPVVPVAPPPG